MAQMNWGELLLPYENCTKELSVKFDCLTKEFNTRGLHSPIQSVESRIKTVSSILDKCRRKGCAPEQFEEILEDVAGIRIICRFVDDIAEVVRLIKQRDGIDLNIIRERDYVSRMKVSGYRSYHLIISYPVFMACGRRDVTCEIQIRTMAMNFWAVTEHSLRYKYNKQIPPDIHKRLIESADAAFMLDLKISEIRLDILAAEKFHNSRENMLDEIIDSLHVLNQKMEEYEVDKLKSRLMKVLSSGDVDKLKEYAEQLKSLTDTLDSSLASESPAI